MISVCIATYNGQEFIGEQIASILSQLGETDELIISDDESTDETINIILSFKDDRIKVFKHKKSSHKYGYRYASENFFSALKKAQGDYIFLCDQDDIWLPNKVVVCLKQLKSYDLVLSDARIIDENNTVLAPSYFAVNNSKKGIVRNFFKNSYLGCCMAFNRQVLVKASPFDYIQTPHDLWLGMVGELCFKVCFIDEPLVLYRRHGNNLSASGARSTFSLQFKFWYRFVLLKELFYKAF